LRSASDHLESHNERIVLFVNGADALALTCLLAVLYRKQNLVFPEHGGSFLVVTDLPKLYGG